MKVIADDLQLGDLVMNEGKLCKVVEVQHIFESTITLDELGTNDGCFDTVTEADAVELAADMWQKLGFRRVTWAYSESWLLTTDFGSVEASDEFEGKWQVKFENEELFNEQSCCHICWLHELQHFLKGCGFSLDFSKLNI